MKTTKLPEIKLLEMRGARGSSTVAPDNNELSILFDDAICSNEAKDEPNIVSARVIAISIAVQLDRPHSVLCDLRGAFVNSSEGCWALASSSAHGRRITIDSSWQRGNFTTRLKFTAAQSGTYQVSLTAIAQRDPGQGNSRAETVLDSLDISLRAKPRARSRRKS